MIKLRELNPRLHHTDEDTKINIHHLHFKMNWVRRHYDRPMYVTSGLRSFDDHKAIYLKKGIILPPLKSMHLIGAACDIKDYDGKLKRWVMNHLDLMDSIDLYLEDFSATTEWVHFQIFPPKSGKRMFIP